MSTFNIGNVGDNNHIGDHGTVWNTTSVVPQQVDSEVSALTGELIRLIEVHRAALPDPAVLVAQARAVQESADRHDLDVPRTRRILGDIVQGASGVSAIAAAAQQVASVIHGF